MGFASFYGLYHKKLKGSIMPARQHFTFPVEPWEHQRARFFNRDPDTVAEANYDDHNTGKTKSAIDWMGYLSFCGDIKTCVVFVKKDTNRFINEIHKHISPEAGRFKIINHKANMPPHEKGDFIEYHRDQINYVGLLILVCPYVLASKQDSVFSHILPIIKQRGAMLCVADEIHKAKNPQSLTGRFMLEMGRVFDYRMAITAIPIIKEGGSMFVLNEFLFPGFWYDNMESVGLDKPSDYTLSQNPDWLAKSFVRFFNRATYTQGDRFPHYVNMRKLQKLIPALTNRFSFDDNHKHEYSEFTPSNRQSVLIDKINDARAEKVMEWEASGFDERAYDEDWDNENDPHEPKTTEEYGESDTVELHQIGDMEDKPEDNRERMRHINSYNMGIAIQKITRNLPPSPQLLRTLGLDEEEFVVETRSEYNPRLDQLVILTQDLAQGEKVVVYCGSPEECLLIKERLGDKSWIYGRDFRTFQKGRDIMLISLGRADTSINMGDCKLGIFYVRNYKHADDKTCRKMLGAGTKDEPIKFITIICQGVDTKIVRSQSRKQNVASQGFGTATSE